MGELFEVKSHSKGRSSVKRCPDKRGGRGEGRKEGREGKEGGRVFSEGKRQTANIHKVSEGRRLNVCVAGKQGRLHERL